jgi:hypothetical protein
MVLISLHLQLFLLKELDSDEDKAQFARMLKTLKSENRQKKTKKTNPFDNLQIGTICCGPTPKYMSIYGVWISRKLDFRGAFC